MNAMSSEEQPTVPGETDHRTKPSSDAFLSFIASSWAPRDATPPERIPAAPYAEARRAAVSAAFPGERLVIPAGGFKVRSNDTDYRFRPHSAFAHLTGLGTDREPDAVLVLEPRDERDGGGHEPVLYFRPRAERDSKEFFGDARYGEFWVGVRPSLAEVEAELGISARHIDELADALRKDVGATALRVVRDADPDLAALVDAARAEAVTETETGPSGRRDRGRGRGRERRRPAVTRPRAGPVPVRAAAGQGRVRARADAAGRRGDRRGLRGDRAQPARGGRPRPRRALGRGRLRAGRAAPGQRPGLRHDRRGRGPRLHAALDPQRRRRARGRPHPGRRRRRGGLALHRRRDPDAARRRPLHRGATPGVRRGAGRAGGRVWRRPSPATPSATSTPPRSRSSPRSWPSGACCR